MYHNPVLLKESVDGLSIRPGGTYVDATFGGGSHTKEMLPKVGEGKVIAFDQDEDAGQNHIEDARFHFVNRNFRYLIHYLRYFDAIPVDGILADLGVSSHQIDDAGRGFSTRLEGELDMRMNQKRTLTAKIIINTYTEEKLSSLFYNYGEIKHASRLARQIVRSRGIRPVETTADLRSIVLPLAPRNKENQYLAQVFQALRIEVNQELDALKEFLEQCEKVLRPGGRLAVISYHSLEDRLVKNFMRTGNFEGQLHKDFFGNVRAPFRHLQRKPIVPDESEIERNPRSRSAKLRIAEKN